MRSNVAAQKRPSCLFVRLSRDTILDPSLGDWNRNWHDHSQEIATGRVQVHDLPPDKAKEVADLVATTDGIIFHLWSQDERVPSGKVTIAQSVGHVKLSAAEFAKGAAKKPAP